MAQCYIWNITNSFLDMDAIKDMMNEYGFKITNIEFQQNRQLWTIVKTNNTEPSATEKNNIYDFATGVGVGMKWI